MKNKNADAIVICEKSYYMAGHLRGGNYTKMI